MAPTPTPMPNPEPLAEFYSRLMLARAIRRGATMANRLAAERPPRKTRGRRYR